MARPIDFRALPELLSGSTEGDLVIGRFLDPSSGWIINRANRQVDDSGCRALHGLGR